MMLVKILLVLSVFQPSFAMGELDCPSNRSFRLTSRRRVCECPPGTFVDGRLCNPCPPTTFNPSPGAPSCNPCPPGTFDNPKLKLYEPAPVIGAVSCKQCPPGRTSVEGSKVCQPCPDGTFASSNGTASCTPCPRGSFSRAGYTRCFRGCPPGRALSRRRSTCAECPPGSFRRRGASPKTCSRCPSGTTSERGSTKCTKCPKGTFRRNVVDTDGTPLLDARCRKCDRNTFGDTRGLEACKLCPLGTVAEPGAKKCTSCPAGTFRPKLCGIRASRCRTCPEGTTSLGKRPAGCKHPQKGCPVNTFEDRHGECRACMPGEELDIEKKRCIPCGKRQVSIGGITTTCKTCPRGQKPADSSSIFEKSRCECLPGTESDEVGGCIACPPGTRWLQDRRGGGVNDLVFGRLYRSGRCENCPRGSFQDKAGKKECKPCPFESYSGLRATSCKRCPDGTTNISGDPKSVDGIRLRTTCFSKLDGCELGTSTALGDGSFDVFSWECIGCPVGTLPSVDGGLCGSCNIANNFLNGSRCMSCPDGQASVGELAAECRVCPKNMDSFEDGTCRCLGRFGADGKGGCKRCAKDEFSIRGQCGKCPEGNFFRRFSFGTFCTDCGNSRFFVPGTPGCMRCPPGFVSEEDLFGHRMNSCVPRDLYPVS